LSSKITSTKIIYSQSHDPWYNLALEEALLNDVTPNEIILFLWQNEHTVVIGRNQNSWRESRWKELEEDGGKVARRISGGGAVYHDLGNLNFTFIVDKKHFDLERQLKVILNAVKSFGIKAEFSGRNDILAEGRKFSGNAFYETSEAKFQHGTILVNVDFSVMAKFLKVSEDKMASKGVKSVQARVINLKELCSDLTVESMQKAMEKSFLEEYGGNGEMISPSHVTKDLSDLYDKYSSWEWRYGNSPKFDVCYKKRFEWGGVEVGFTLKDGQITACTIYSDAMDSQLIVEVSAHLEQIPFQMDAMILKLEKLIPDSKSDYILNDLKEWMKEQAI
jgi:lipoate---protein ligase